MPNHEDHANGWCCTDCLHLLANGETPPELSEEETDAYLARVIEAEAGGHISLGRMLGEDGCECEDWDTSEHQEGCERQEFSRTCCDVCQSPLAGYREAVTFWPVREDA